MCGLVLCNGCGCLGGGAAYHGLKIYFLHVKELTSCASNKFTINLGTVNRISKLHITLCEKTIVIYSFREQMEGIASGNYAKQRCVFISVYTELIACQQAIQKGQENEHENRH